MAATAVQLVVVVAAALALWEGASAAGVHARRPKFGKAMNGPPKFGIPPGSRFDVITPRKFHKRKYEVACTGENKISRGCYVGCPSECPNKCLVFCAYCLSFCMCDIFPGTSCGDPRFTGGDGNTFYFHGKKDEDFCIVSDKSLHINAHFIGNHNPELKRDFTWVQAIGVLFFSSSNVGGDLQQQLPHRLYIGAISSSSSKDQQEYWDEEQDHIQITLDGEPVHVEAVKNARWESESPSCKGLSVTRLGAANTVVVELAGVFSISANAVPITDEDDRIHRYGANKRLLVHLDLGFNFHGGALTDDVHGVLGQTYRPDYVTSLNITAKMPIMGGAPKYMVSHIFSTDCAVSTFHRHRTTNTNNNAATAAVSSSYA